MKYDFTIRIYKDECRNPVLSDLQSIEVSGITLISKMSKYQPVTMHKSNQKKFHYSISTSKPFNVISGSNSYPSLSFKGEYIDIIVKDFPRYPVFYQDESAARNYLNGYTNYMNDGFPIQLLYRKIEIIMEERKTP